MSDLEFPIEQDVSLPMTRTGWRQVSTGKGGAKWVAYQRPYPNNRNSGTGVPLKNRMRTLATCTVCHVNSTVLFDHWGAAKGELKERLCKACYATYERSGHSSQYQQRIDDLPVPYANMAHYQEPRRSEPTGEQRLAAAVIASAAADVHRDTDYHGGAKQRADARAWLDGSTDTLMSFGLCCELLDLDPQWVRHMVLISKEKYGNGYDSRRRNLPATRDNPAVDECVPDVDGSQRSQPFRPTPASAAPTLESAIAAAIVAIATYTG